MKVFRVSKPTFNVLTETNKRNLSVDSANFEAIMRIQDRGSGTYTITNALDSTTVTIPHTLGYPAFYQFFIKWTNVTAGTTQGYKPSTGIGGPGPTTLINTQTAIDASNLYIHFRNTGTADDWKADYYYYIGRDPFN